MKIKIIKDHAYSGKYHLMIGEEGSERTLCNRSCHYKMLIVKYLSSTEIEHDYHEGLYCHKCGSLKEYLDVGYYMFSFSMSEKKTLKVDDLVTWLEYLDPNATVLMSGDEEGNHFHLMWMIYGEEKYQGKPAVILWPHHAWVEPDEKEEV